MDKKTAGLLGAVAGLATMGTANAAGLSHAPSQALHASSYADLLAPIPHAVEQLRADDAARAGARVTQAADFYVSYGYRAPYSYGAPSYPYEAYTYRRDDYPRSYQEHHHHHHHHHRGDGDWR